MYTSKIVDLWHSFDGTKKSNIGKVKTGYWYSDPFFGIFLHSCVEIASKHSEYFNITYTGMISIKHSILLVKIPKILHL